ncbi:hypothetical protein [Paeniglutamicibacter sp.]|uniref:hypothetical protein n=1 Tax=Paeniglutamicibacter sp. TaxID=1934391 RepID=UPI00398A19DA
MATTSSGRVPMLGENGRFPDHFAPASVAVDAAAAVSARDGAQLARTGAETARDGSVVAAAGAIEAKGLATLEADRAEVAAEAATAPTDEVMATKINTPGSATEIALSATIGKRTGLFSANEEGADPAADYQTNRAAIQSANDKATAAGGGTVTLEPGVYTVKGIVQDSRVIFDMPGVTLKSPDGLAPGIITTRLNTRTGNAVKDARTLTITDGGTAGIEFGSRVAVFAAGGILDSQQTVLTAAIDGVTTALTLANVTGLATTGTLLVDSELITFTGRTGAALTGVTRGAYGTIAAAHTTIAPIGIARRLYATVMKVDGNTLTLDRPAISAATGVPVSFGAVGSGIIGYPTIDGNKPLAGAPSSVHAVLVQLGSWGVYDLRVVNGETGGFMFARGAAHNHAQRIHLHDCSVPAASKGSALWIYQACERNHFEEVQVTGHAWVGVYLDDRTSTNEEGWDGPCSYNTVVTTNIDVTESLTGVLNVVSGRYNRFLGGRLKSPKIGLNCSSNSQGSANGAPSVGNEFAGFTFNVGETPYTLYASGNLLHDSYVEASHPSFPPVVADGNTVYAVSPAPGVAPQMPLAYRMNILENTRITDWTGWEIPVATGTGSAGGVLDVSDTATTFNPLVYNTTPVPVGPGVPIAGAVDVTVPAGYPAITLAAVVIAYRKIDALNWALTNSVVGPIITINPGETKRLTAAMPATAALTEAARLQIQMRTTALAGRRIIVSPKPVLERGVTQAGALFNGDDTGAMWVGTAGASPSIKF